MTVLRGARTLFVADGLLMMARNGLEPQDS